MNQPDKIAVFIGCALLGLTIFIIKFDFPPNIPLVVVSSLAGIFGFLGILMLVVGLLGDCWRNRE
ncbi:MAG: hypothetical protein HYY55_02435 [Candidatus Niyogibacteria bacterium]|nr:MAG: hypothetical protein HYY55_02435 [Candidatus Niyogibacteria bacterium]